MLRRNLLSGLVTAGSLAALPGSRPQITPQQPTPATGGGIFLERPATGQPHKGKVLLVLEAHSDDVPLMAAGTVAKLIEEGYTG